MKKIILTLSVLTAVGFLGFALAGRAQEKASPKYEYAIVKWDGPDRLLYNMPNQRFELVHLEEQGIPVPRNAQNEEYCLAVACNIMAKSGWEPVNLDSRRIVFRRPAAQ